MRASLFAHPVCGVVVLRCTDEHLKPFSECACELPSEDARGQPARRQCERIPRRTSRQAPRRRKVGERGGGSGLLDPATRAHFSQT